MLLRVVFAVLGGSMGIWGVSHFMLSDWDISNMARDHFYLIIWGVMAIVIVLVMAFIGGFLGYGIAYLIGLCFPQRYDNQPIQLRRVRREFRTRYTPVVGSTVTPQGTAGTTTTMIPETVPVLHYTYTNEEGEEEKDEIDESSATVLRRDIMRPVLLVRTWSFVWPWVDLIAASRTTEYTFLVPEEYTL